MHCGGGHHPACHKPWRLAGTGAGALCEQLLAPSVDPGYEGGDGALLFRSISSALNVELRRQARFHKTKVETQDPARDWGILSRCFVC